MLNFALLLIIEHGKEIVEKCDGILTTRPPHNMLALRQPERHKQKIRRVAPSVVQLRFPEMDNLGEDQAFS
jgi:hypothetical protein